MTSQDKIEQEIRIEEAKKWFENMYKLNHSILNLTDEKGSQYITDIINSCDNDADKAFLMLKYSDLIEDLKKKEEIFDLDTTYYYKPSIIDKILEISTTVLPLIILIMLPIFFLIWMVL